ncbi:MAG: WecB/TagA/CpsF family glycosyltransferase [Pseudanabaenaceae cyanobacterium bins.39]|nr:WecB/TagA/CpsF family glycosyltransferase [Pseudanabaenaceae cyanobacterium bins.39]
MRQFKVLDMPVHIHSDYSAWLSERLRQGLGTHVVTLNAEMTMQAQQNLALAEIIQQAEMVVPDGSGIVLYLRSQGEKIKRCPGIELSEGIVQVAAESQAQIFLIGGAPGVVDRVVENWRQRWTNIAIAGQYNGYFDAAIEQEICDRLQQTQPNLILVGLGVPRQELWINQHRHLCPKALWIGVGGSFDVWSGIKSRAPKWIGDNHLEWLYRLYQEPWRWKRMLSLPRFVWTVTKDSWR